MSLCILIAPECPVNGVTLSGQVRGIIWTAGTHGYLRDRPLTCENASDRLNVDYPTFKPKEPVWSIKRCTIQECIDEGAVAKL